jgi:imidazolonepropionase-like amidohydrolase
VYKAAILLLCLLPLSATAETLALKGGTIIDGTGRRRIKNGAIVIRDRIIEYVGPAGEVTVPVDARVIDTRGKYIVPGLVDAHVHFFQSGSLFTRPDVIDLQDMVPYEREQRWFRNRLEYTFNRYLASGVTSVLDAGGTDWVFQVRSRAANLREAPRVAVCGPLITTYRGQPYTLSDSPLIHVETPEDARRAVMDIADREPNLVKIWFIREEDATLQEQLKIYEAAIHTAHVRGMRVLAHATELETAKAVLRAGADVLAHSVHDEVVDDEFIGLIRSRDAVYITTIVVYEGFEEVLQRRVRLTRIEKKRGDQAVIATWGMLKRKRPPHHLRGWYEKVGKPVVLKNLKILQDAGVTVAAGSDAGNIGTLHGPSLHREFELMADAGLTPAEILISATASGAKAISPDPLFGTLERGNFADLLILESNPLITSRNLSKIDGVVANGKYFDHETLESRNPPPPLSLN